MATKTATVNASDVPSTLTNYPTYIDLSRLGITTQAEADSVRIYTDAGLTTEVAREIVSVSECHAKIPSLTSTTQIWVDYDGLRANYGNTDTYGRNAVWSGYTAVYHLNDTTDSTGNGYTLTNTSTTFSTGKLGNGAVLNGTTSNLSRVKDSVFIPTTTATYSVWIKPTSLIGNNSIMGLFDTVSNNESPWWISDASGNLYTRSVAPAVSALTSSGDTVSAGTWKYVQLQYGSGNQSFVMDAVGRGSASHGTLPTNQTALNLGTRTGSAQYGNHTLDEFRYIKSVLSANWITTEYNNQSDEAGFWGTWSTVGGGFTSTPQMHMMQMTGGAVV